jgi:signal peptidase I
MTGPSMEPSVRAREVFTATSPAEPLERGMLGLFRYVDEDGEFTVLRRLAALPGDTIAMDAGAVVLNGVRQPWPFRIVNPAAHRSPLARGGELYDWGPLVVPRDSVFLLADTRDVFGWPDSRFLGPIAIRDIVARAWRIVWSREPGRWMRRAG